MQRRDFVRAAVALTGGLAFGCTPWVRSAMPPRRPMVALAPVRVSADRVIRTTVGLRPFREGGFRVSAERFEDRVLIHNYGHGGAGMSLSWGTAQLAGELALEQPERSAAVIGCGVAGLTTARMLQRRGFTVTLYATSLPPDTTSNMSWATFTPLSGLVSADQRTAAWDAQFRRAVEISYRELQLLAGRHYGVSWMDEYSPTNSAGTGASSAEAGRAAAEGATPPERLLPDSVVPGAELLQPGEHPFPTRYARRRPTLRFEPNAYLDALHRDVLYFGGRTVIRTFDSLRDLAALDERVIVNCTGLGAFHLFGDTRMAPIRGQLIVLVPQPEVNYIVGGMHPRSDGIALGHTMERGVWSLEVNEPERARVLAQAARLFAAMSTAG